MFYLCKRNLLLYFRNHARVFFSLLGALITFVLYVVFLKKTFQTSWQQLPNSKQLLDRWQIGGTLAVTSITTTLSGLAVLVSDRETNVLADLTLTKRSNWQIHLSYLISSTIIGIILQLVLLISMVVYFHLTDNLNFPWHNLLQICLIIILSSILAVLLNDLLLYFIKTNATLGQFSTIIGTASGFLVGAYLPLGSLPKFAQLLMKLTPGTYVASIYRQLLVGNSVAQPMRAEFAKIMGIRLKWNHLLTLQQTFLVVISILFAALLVDYLLQKVKA
ncbi:ABC transporter permease [Lactobacillus sp. ESL0791]|uniref:ABC transporter permease n=1 Tax=Lactobacillus sp. ESL0791 TaxID=2983234 RepID=UPI0023F8CE60|nr:ABC transporter permease [Lactobacillus sp. ESL0791]MDF7638412.1 ABC transporter permease [Lactobacillus sp. ESL0791]